MRNNNISNRLFYKLLKQFMATFGRSPTYEEIMTFTDLTSYESVRYHLNKLEKQGIIEYETSSMLQTHIKLKEDL